MKKEAILLILAAGMGSRYGGLKQIDQVGPAGEILMDYSLYDAHKAGFKRVVFVIRKEDEKAFHEAIGNRISQFFEVQYAFQSLDDLPAGFTRPAERVKPWGTAHALLAARNVIDAPFAVINADDYYGQDAYQQIYNRLSQYVETEKPVYSMIPFVVSNTLSDHGTVTRGVCQIDENSLLRDVVERHKIRRAAEGGEYTLDDGQTWHPLPSNTPVSMNFWGFGPSFIRFCEADFPNFLTECLKENPLKGEYLLPNFVGELIHDGKADVYAITSTDRWYGITYKEDKPLLMAALQELTDRGLYPSPLWENK